MTEIERRLRDAPDGGMVAVPAPPPNPMAMIAVAIDKGYDADQLGKLVALHDKWAADEARKAFSAAMSACQREMPVVVKDAENKHTRSFYARLESLTAAIKPVYVRHGFSLSFGTADSQLPNHYRVVCDVRHAGGHAERYQADIPADGTGAKGGAMAMTGPQAAGSTYSYGQRYLQKLIFNLTIADEDDDAIDSSGGITELEAMELDALRGEAGVNGEQFLAWAKVTKYSEMSRKQFEAAKVMLSDRIRRKKNGGAK